jgi:hypothetical protein
MKRLLASPPTRDTARALADAREQLLAVFADPRTNVMDLVIALERAVLELLAAVERLAS